MTWLLRTDQIRIMSRNTSWNVYKNTGKGAMKELWHVTLEFTSSHQRCYWGMDCWQFTLHYSGKRELWSMPTTDITSRRTYQCLQIGMLCHRTGIITLLTTSYSSTIKSLLKCSTKWVHLISRSATTHRHQATQALSKYYWSAHMDSPPIAQNEGECWENIWLIFNTYSLYGRICGQ